jgi:hypothetical protein
MYTAEPLVPERCAFGIEIAIDTVKRHKSSVIDRIRTDVIKQNVEVRYDIYKRINTVWNIKKCHNSEISQ